MDVLQLVGFAIVALAVLVAVRPQRPEVALMITIAAGAAILVAVLSKVQNIIMVITDLSERANIESPYLAVVLKVIGVAYLAGFAAEVCKDAGEGALASKVEVAGKIIILALAVPVMVALMETLLRLVP